MRHTRRRQMFNRKQRESLGVYDRSYTIVYVRNKLPYTLDPTFKWHRECDYGGNWIELGGDGYKYGVLLEAKACYKTLKGLTK
ncbi:hypothetical protein COF71_13780 [Bacillus toyonensis]|nr:hypothetical protein COM61_22685 [Bacillus toyonensis]PHE47021.1 hypothetical protein COF71_13780 [Bacillus toyonensis]